MCDAILQAWYPGQQGGKAVADVLFGHYNPAGRLPVTFYKNTEQLPDFEDYNMANRTYRYIMQEPLFAFGHGLSYTTLSIWNAQTYPKQHQSRKKALLLTVPVTNNSWLNGDEVVQVYIKRENDPNGPNKTLRAFDRVMIQKGETLDVKFEISAKSLEWWNESLQKMTTQPGRYQIMIGGSSNDVQLKSIELTVLE
jgi:beta-glucosidase